MEKKPQTVLICVFFCTDTDILGVFDLNDAQSGHTAVISSYQMNAKTLLVWDSARINLGK